MGFADDNFAVLCPDVSSVKEWCLSPPSEGICCGICPNGGVSGLLNVVSLGFNTLSSLAAIALSPESASSSLLVNLLQCNAYAIALLGTVLTGTGALDFFHAGFALLTALSCIIPLTAVAAVPSWATTGEEAPAVKRRRLEILAAHVLVEIKSKLDDVQDRDSSSDSGSDDDDSERGLKKHATDRKKRQVLRKLKRMLRSDPEAFVNASYGKVPASHIVLYLGFSLSVMLWSLSWFVSIKGGLTNQAMVKLAQPNCTSKLQGASALAFACAGFLLLAVIAFLITVGRLAMQDITKQVSDSEPHSSRFVFFVSFPVWCIWMATAVTLWWNASQSILLVNGEISFSFGTVFSYIMTLVPITNVLRALFAHR